MAQTKAAVPSARLDTTLARALLTQMQLIRRFEEKAAEMYAMGKIGGFLHLYIGQEAVAVGAMSTLRPDDYAISSYREHGHCLAKGSDPKRVMAELFGRRDGLSKGKGGSMHLFDKSVNFLGGHGIVGAHLPPAAGAAFAIKYQGGDQVVLCFFGDGAVPEGEFHESLNLAALWKLPVIFICENTGLSRRRRSGASPRRMASTARPWTAWTCSPCANAWGAPSSGRGGTSHRSSSRCVRTASGGTRCATRRGLCTGPRRRSSARSCAIRS